MNEKFPTNFPKSESAFDEVPDSDIGHGPTLIRKKGEGFRVVKETAHGPVLERENQQYPEGLLNRLESDSDNPAIRKPIREQLAGMGIPVVPMEDGFDVE